MTTRRIPKTISAILSMVMAAAIIPYVSAPDAVRADWTKTQDNTKLGTGQIAAPSIPTAPTDPWTGSYVYYGKYDGEPIRFRVLAPSTGEYGGTTMFLDSDAVLFKESVFDENRINDWADDHCIARKNLNGSWFLTKDNGFSDPERNAIAESKIKGGIPFEEGSYEQFIYGSTVALNGEKIFLLDVSEVMNPEYGYIHDVGLDYEPPFKADTYYKTHDVITRFKLGPEGDIQAWWLRSAATYYGSPITASVTTIGSTYCWGGQSIEGISPAMNVDLNSVLFSSLVSGKSGEVNSEYKLTIIDKDISLALSDGKKIVNSKGDVTIPYSLSGKDKDSVSAITVLITDKDYKDSSASIKYYGKLNVKDPLSSAEGTFALPSAYSKGDHVYLIAEDINGEKETDYASEPLEITVPEDKDKPTDTPTPTPTSEPAKGGGFEDFVERLYTVALNRASEPEGKAFWCKHVGNGDLDGAQCAKEFLLSKEFNDRKLSDEDFLKVLYKTFFDRDAEKDPDGYNFWMNSLKTQGRDVVVDCFINSEEWCNVCASYGVRSGATRAKATIASANATAFATRLYTECLGRDPEEGGLKFWSLGLTNQELSGTQAAKEFFYSPEFVNAKYGDEEYINRMYKTFMGRDPEPEGKAYWLNELKNGTTRDEVFNFFSTCPEFTEICKTYAIQR